MQRAASLLRDGVKAEAVALLVGYRSRPNFYRQFKKHFGSTPAAYRERFQSSPR
jgi:AraC-like DNA-binding protein